MILLFQGLVKLKTVYLANNYTISHNICMARHVKINSQYYFATSMCDQSVLIYRDA